MKPTGTVLNPKAVSNNNPTYTTRTTAARRTRRRTAQAYLWLSGIATLIAAPVAWIVFADPRPAVYLPAVVIAELLLFASTGPINSAILNEVAPGQRATAVALSILAIHVLGDVPSPPLIGRISDASSLGRAVLIMPVAILIAGAIWTLAAWLGARGAGARVIEQRVR